MNPLPDNHPASDDALLGALAAGNPAALARLMERHGGLVLNVARGVLRDHHAAEDVAQAVFLALARKARRLRGTGTVAPWLYRVTHDLAVNAVRQQERRRRREQEAAAMPSLAEPPRESLTPEQHQQLHAQLRGLPERYRAPLVLCYLEGQPGEQAAQALGLHPAALRKRLERGRDRLRRRLTRLGWSAGAAGAVTALLTAEAGAAPVPAALIAATTSAAAGGSVSATVAGLTQGALHMIFWNNVKTVSLAAAVGLAATGTGIVVAKQSTTAPPASPPAATSQRTAATPATPASPATTASAASRESCAASWLRRAAQESAGITNGPAKVGIWYGISRAWAQLGNIEEFNAAWQACQQAANTANPPLQTSTSFDIEILILALVRNGKTAEAVKCCEGLPANRQFVAKTVLARRLAEAGKEAEARAIAASCPAAETERIHSEIALGLAQAGLATEAMALAKSLPAGWQGPVYRNLIEAQARRGDYAAAKQTIQNAPEEVRNDAWLTLWGRQLDRGDFAAAKESRQVMPAALAGHRKLSMQYCAALARAGRLDEAKAAALELVGQPQELLAFDMVATEMIKRGDEAGAAAFREKISPALRDRAAKEFRSALVTAAAAAGDAQRAVRHFEELPADERTYPSCLATVGVLYRTGDTAGARRYVELAKTAAQTAGDKYDALHRQQTLAQTMAAGGDLDAALQWARALPEKQDADNAMVSLVSGCTEAGQFDRALSLIKAMAGEDHRVSAVHPFARFAAEKNRWADLPAWIDALPGARERAVACLEVAKRCAMLPGAATATAAGGDPGKVFKPIDQAQPGFYADGKWSYAYEPRQGTLKYDGRDLSAAQPGDYILTPWGWMQWQNGTWLPVAEKPATGTQLPDPAQ